MASEITYSKNSIKLKSSKTRFNHEAILEAFSDGNSRIILPNQDPNTTILNSIMIRSHIVEPYTDLTMIGNPYMRIHFLGTGQAFGITIAFLDDLTQTNNFSVTGLNDFFDNMTMLFGTYVDTNSDPMVDRFLQINTPMLIQQSYDFDYVEPAADIIQVQTGSIAMSFDNCSALTAGHADNFLEFHLQYNLIRIGE